MPSTPADLNGAALTAPVYQIVIQVFDKNNHEYSTNICAVDSSNEPPAPGAPRRHGTAVNDWIHGHLTWNSDPNRGMKLRPNLRTADEKALGEEDDAIAKEIRDLAEQKGERVPDKKEARAMACIARLALGLVRSAKSIREFGVQNEKDFVIISSKTAEGFEATLFVNGTEKAVAKGVGKDHWEAVIDKLWGEVGPEYARRRKEQGL